MYAGLVFKIGVHIKDSELLERLSVFFGVGKVYLDRTFSCQFIVQTISEMEIIIKHFDNYPLVTKKKGTLSFFVKHLI